MKVRELIQKLLEHSMDLEVVIPRDDFEYKDIEKVYETPRSNDYFGAKCEPYIVVNLDSH